MIFKMDVMKLLTAVLLLLCYASLVQNMIVPYGNGTVKTQLDNIEANSGLEDDEQQQDLTGIIGGKRASIQKYKYTCAVISSATQEGAATILNKNWVLTTAWAILYEQPEAVLVRCGSNSALLGGQAVWANKLIIHPEYKNSYASNLGLIKLKTPLSFNKNVGPAKISANDIVDSQKGELVGFGTANSSRQSEPQGIPGIQIHDGWLRTGTFKTLTYTTCNRIFSSKLDECYFCTNVTDRLKPSTYDSGDLLVVNNGLAGILSQTANSFDKNRPAIYVKVSQFKPWIDQTIKKNMI